MDKKIFTIEINGIKESVEAVTSLNKQLDALDKRINELNSRKVTVQATVSSTPSSSNASALNEEAAIEKEILALKNEGTKLEAKQVAYQDESYQKVLAQKDVLKEIVQDQKTIAAQERLQADTYSNTMQGMKAKLADLKTSIASTDLGDSDKLKSMTTEANELTNKLKEMEEAYGQFGRNVGNYQSAAEGFKGLEFTVGGVTQQFDNAKQALKTLQGELRNLQVKKDQGMILSPEEVKRFQELPSVVAKLKSSIQDAGKPMDNLMDTMQSFVAIAQVSKGASAFFGIDSDKIEESIQKLVALQNVMQGMQALQKQIQSQEFLGGWLSKGNEAIDNLVAKLTSANTAQQALTTTTNAGATASKAMATAEGAQAVATKATTVATKGLSLALKSIGIGLIISAVAALITYWDDIKKLFTDTVPALKNLSTWFNKVKAVVVGVGTSIINYFVQPIATAGKLIAAVIEGNFKDIPKIITDGFKKTFNVVGNFQKGYNKEIQRQQDAHNEEMRKKQLKANEEAEKDAEAKYGKDAKRTKKYLNDQLKLVKKGSEEEKELKRKLWQTEREEKEKNNKKNLADSKKNAKEEAETEKELSKAKIEAMKDGLLKTITQLEEERKERLSKISTNTRNYKELELEINKAYDKKIEDARKEYAKNVENIQKEMYMNLLNQRIDYFNKSVSILEKSEELMKEKQEKAASELFNQNISSYGIQAKNSYSPSTQQTLGIISTSNNEMVNDYKELMNLSREYASAQNALKNATIRNNDEIEEAETNLLNIQKETTKKLNELEKNRASMSDEEYEKEKYNIQKSLDVEEERVNRLKEYYNLELDSLKEMLSDYEQEYNEYEAFLNQKYSSQEDQLAATLTKQALLEENYTDSLSLTFEQRLQANETYWAMVASRTKDYAENIAEEQLHELQDQKDKELKELENKYTAEIEVQEKWLSGQTELLQVSLKQGVITQEKYNAELEKINEEYRITQETSDTLYKARREEIIKQSAQKEEEINNNKLKKIQSVNAEYYQSSLQELRDFQTAVSNLEGKADVKNVFGFTNWKETNKNNRELLAAYEQQASVIQQKRKQINDDFKNGLIDKKSYESSLREFDGFLADLGEKIDATKQKLSGWNMVQTIAQEAQQYIQAFANVMGNVLEAMWTAEDAEFEREQENLERQLDAVEEYYDKMDEAAKDHAENMKSLESDIASAQGDARDRLIQRYNAEKQAQREALKEKKKAEKEEEKLKKRQEELDRQQREREKQRDLTQAAINTAMAITSAAVNHWPIPAVPMMAAAAAAGAAQIAAIQAKQYANGGQLDGGVAVGNRHSNGGIKVLGGRAEIEGGEFITNRQTTMNNVALLEFINSSKKRVNLDDMIEFYGGKKSKVASNVIGATNRKYADGGTLPIISNYSNNDALAAALERYANRPSYVAVTDIIDKTADVNNVRVMAGLGD